MNNKNKFSDVVRNKDEKFATTGIASIDSLIPNMVSKDLFVITGEDGVGKTALAFQIGYHAATKEKLRVAFMSNELSIPSLMRRQFPAACRFEEGLRDDDACKQKATLLELPLFFSPFHGMDSKTLEKEIDKQVSNQKIDMIIVDSLQGIEGSDDYIGNRCWQVDQMVRMFKSIAAKKNIIVILVSHKSRLIRMAPFPSPATGKLELRDSSAEAQLSDTILEIEPCRKDIIELSLEESQIQIIRVNKARNGFTGDADVRFVCDDYLGPHFVDTESFLFSPEKKEGVTVMSSKMNEYDGD